MSACGAKFSGRSRKSTKLKKSLAYTTYEYGSKVPRKVLILETEIVFKLRI